MYRLRHNSPVRQSPTLLVERQDERLAGVQVKLDRVGRHLRACHGAIDEAAQRIARAWLRETEVPGDGPHKRARHAAEHVAIDAHLDVIPNEGHRVKVSMQQKRERSRGQHAFIVPQRSGTIPLRYQAPHALGGRLGDGPLRRGGGQDLDARPGRTSG
jgi:hypothetical protein